VIERRLLNICEYINFDLCLNVFEGEGFEEVTERFSSSFYKGVVIQDNACGIILSGASIIIDIFLKKKIFFS
jgi:hypothetical protein